MMSSGYSLTFKQQRCEGDQRRSQAGDQVSVGLVVPGRVLEEEHQVKKTIITIIIIIIIVIIEHVRRRLRQKLTAMLLNCWNCFLNFPGRP